MLLGYARVSKADEQDTAAQVSALTAAGCTRVYEEKASGGRWDRLELHRMLDHLREGDAVVVWKLDRLSRSLKDLPCSFQATFLLRGAGLAPRDRNDDGGVEWLTRLCRRAALTIRLCLMPRRRFFPRSPR
jgi:hypothetical protein